jgi:hypothetical protein|tara:strand:- start:138 stop:731 length:594 start_codon:yes stop_codon:yes gene_type:complete
LASPISAYVTKKATEKTGELLEKKLGYNFLDLITKLVLFYSISFIISKYMEAVVYFQGGLQTVAGFFGIKLVQSDQLPKQWVELFVTETEVVSSTPTAHGQFNPPGWDRPYDYGSIEHQKEEPHLFPQKQTKFKFWDFVNAIAVFYIGWEAYKYYENGGRDFLTIGIFTMIILVLSVLSFSKFIGKFGFNKFQEENK